MNKNDYLIASEKTKALSNVCLICGIEGCGEVIHDVRGDQSYCRDCGKDGETQLQPYRDVYLCAECYEIDITEDINESL